MAAINAAQASTEQDMKVAGDAECASLPPSEPRSTSSSSKKSTNLTRCEECKKQDSIYVCPRCRIRTCSLPCCQSHKERTGCNGKRDRTAFKPIGRMTDGDLRSDYFFLEEVLGQMPRNRKRARLPPQQPSRGGKSTAATSATTVSAPAVAGVVDKSDLDPLHTKTTQSHKSKRLAQQAQIRGITLQLMPPVMERHTKNTSSYNLKKNTIFWKVDVIVEPEKRLVSFSVSENEEDIFIKHIAKRCFGTDFATKQKQTKYHLFLKKIPTSAKNPKYVKIDQTSSLKQALAGETIIEYPTIYCVPESQIEEYPIGSDMIVDLSASSAEMKSKTSSDPNPK